MGKIDQELKAILEELIQSIDPMERPGYEKILLVRAIRKIKKLLNYESKKR